MKKTRVPQDRNPDFLLETEDGLMGVFHTVLPRTFPTEEEVLPEHRKNRIFYKRDDLRAASEEKVQNFDLEVDLSEAVQRRKLEQAKKNSVFWHYLRKVLPYLPARVRDFFEGKQEPWREVFKRALILRVTRGADKPTDILLDNRQTERIWSSRC